MTTRQLVSNPPHEIASNTATVQFYAAGPSDPFRPKRRNEFETADQHRRRAPVCAAAIVTQRHHCEHWLSSETMRIDIGFLVKQNL